MNSFCINATLTKDPDLKYGQSGTPMLFFSVAYNHNKDEASFFDCKAWNRTAEFIAQYFRQGDGVNLEGEIRQERWEDNKGGGLRQMVRLHVRRASFPHGKKGERKGDSAARAQPQAQRPTPSRSSRQSYADEDDALGVNDIPF